MLYQIIPSILSADFTRLGEEIENVKKAGINTIHFDVMDNHYVPTITFGPCVLESIHKRFPELKIDVHLMTHPVESMIEQFAKAGASRISIHPDSCYHLDKNLQMIKDFGLEAGIVLNPATSIDCIRWCIRHLDFILIMLVNPGFAGQTLIEDQISKVGLVNSKFPRLPICVDGGITPDTIGRVAAAGATQFVAGSGIFKSADYMNTVELMRKCLVPPFKY